MIALLAEAILIPLLIMIVVAGIAVLGVAAGHPIWALLFLIVFEGMLLVQIIERVERVLRERA